MKLLALDLANACGWAFGETGPNAKPIYGTWKLDQTVDYPAPAILAQEIRALFKEHGPADFIITEATMHPSQQPHANVIVSQERFHGAVLACVGLWKCRWRQVAPAKIRKFVCGKANAGERKLTKQMVVQTMRWRGFATTDDNQADALAAFLYANHVLLRNAEGELVMFNA